MTLGKKADFRKQIDTQIDELEKQVADIKGKVETKADEVADEVEVMQKKALAELEEKKLAAKKALNDIKDDDDDDDADEAWRGIKSDVQKTVDDIRASVSKVLNPKG